MSQNLTRRTVVSVAPAAVVAAALPPTAFAEAGDAHLFDLGRRLAHHDALAAEAERRQDAASALYERAVPNETPDALLVRPDDNLAMEICPAIKGGLPTGEPAYDRAAIEKVEAKLQRISELSHEAFTLADPRYPTKLARLREIVEIHSEWRAARRVAWDAAGMPEAEQAAYAAHGRRKEVMREIAWCPATTVHGVLFKARVAMHCFGDTLGEAEAEIDDELGRGIVGRKPRIFDRQGSGAYGPGNGRSECVSPRISPAVRSLLRSRLRHSPPRLPLLCRRRRASVIPTPNCSSSSLRCKSARLIAKNAIGRPTPPSTGLTRRRFPKP